jgi:hypothetical protein
MASRPTALGDPACADACRMSILRVAADGTVVAVDPASGAVSYAGALGLGFDGIAFVPCAVRVLTLTVTLRRGRRSARLPLLCPRGCDEEWDLEYRTELSFENLRPLRHARRIAATLGPDQFVESTHPRAEQQARIRVTVRLRG